MRLQGPHLRWDGQSVRSCNKGCWCLFVCLLLINEKTNAAAIVRYCIPFSVPVHHEQARFICFKDGLELLCWFYLYYRGHVSALSPKGMQLKCSNTRCTVPAQAQIYGAHATSSASELLFLLITQLYCGMSITAVGDLWRVSTVLQAVGTDRSFLSCCFPGSHRHFNKCPTKYLWILLHDVYRSIEQANNQVSTPNRSPQSRLCLCSPTFWL